MVSLEASRPASGDGVPFETVFARVEFVPALVSLVVVSIWEDERRADGAIAIMVEMLEP